MYPTTQIATSFLTPFSRDQLHEDVLNIALLHLRVSHLFADSSAVWGLLGKTAERHMWNPDSSPADLGLAYVDFANCDFARALEQQYDYGFFAVLRKGVEPLEYESVHTWVAAHLMDLKNSESAAEWATYGADFSDSVDRCLRISELANARLVLEGADQTFSYFSRVGRDKADAATAVNGLTVRQLALLSGMEEMSIRTAVSRKALEAFKDQGRTLFDPKVAKAWLQAKGRYVPVTVAGKSGGLQLESCRYSGTEEFIGAVRAEAERLSREAAPDRHEELAQIARSGGFAAHDSLSRDHLLNSDLMKSLATVLQLPPDLFALRAKETALREELARIEQELRGASDAQNSAGEQQ